MQTALAAIGPALREPVLASLVGRGDITREPRRILGLIPTAALREGRTGRRAGLLDEVRQVLAEGAEPPARVAALAALLSASGTLPQFHPEIPWTSSVIKRAKELERGDRSASAAAEAVTRTVTTTIINNTIAAIAVSPRGQ